MAKKIIAIIPARSGSKGIRHKNILRLNNKTLLEIAVLQAKKVNAIEDILISSDSEEYCTIAKKAGCNCLGLRPTSLSGDKIKTIEVLKDIIKSIPEVETILLLQPTSPVRSTLEINEALKICIKQKKCVISVALLEEPNPYKLQKLSNENILSPFIKDNSYNSEIPRQLLPSVYRLTGGFYCLNVRKILECDSVIPPNSIGYPTKMYPNIDTQDDYDYIRFLINSKINLPKDFLEII